MKDNGAIISEKLEDYILTIFRLSKEHGHAHLSEVARRRDVKNSSANAALNSLCEKGYVQYEKYRPIILTEKGEELALKMLERRKTLMKFFVETLGVEKREAQETVCKVEHIFEDKILSKLLSLTKSSEKCCKKNFQPKVRLSNY